MDVHGDHHLSSPQGVLLSTIIAGPFQASETKEKCIDLAKFLNHTYIGVVREYCVSVNNFTKDYNSYDQCKDRSGKYDPSSSIQYMDIYRITSSVKQQHTIKHTSGALPKIGYAVSYITCLFITLILVAVMNLS